ncbi:MAG: glycoside hydrolase family 3 protein [Alphaproteobacteria bacterium]|nr:MAG: glycoside hydrolase family 3 protein [Alphaproteobacteria bacterium]
MASSLLVAPCLPASANQPEIWPVLESPVKQDPAMEAKIDALIAAMTVEEKVGQIVQPEIQYITPKEVRDYHIGSILNGGGSLPHRNKYATPGEWLAMADAFYDASLDVAPDRPKIPLLWGSDAVHGHNNVIGATIFPHNIGLGAAHDVDLMRRIGGVTALEMRVTGIDWTFAPTLAVVQDDRWGRTYESYSEAPELVKAYGGAMVEGLQGVVGTPEFLDVNHVVATAKHFVGDGGTEGGDDQGDAKVSEQELRDIHAAGYESAIEAGVQTAMASFSSWNGVKLHGHKYLLDDILKGRMGFDGPVVSDWNAHGQVKGCSNVSCAQSVNAGIDIVMVPQDWKGFYENTLQDAKAGIISSARLDEAVRRILRMKFRAGLFDKPRPSARGVAGKDGIIGQPAHKALAREAVRKSLVLLKNKDHVLPIQPGKTVLVIGDGADNIGKQAGGWTISWQGTGNQNSDFPGGTSIYDGIKERVEAAGGTVVLAADGKTDVKPDVVIAVYGENPYAEFQGDRDTLEYEPGDKTDLALVKPWHDAGIPVVSVFLSGRPLWVNPEMNASDAFVAAWLPGSQGAGVADVLVAGADGTPAHDFTGRLSFSWPKTPLQAVLDRRHPNYDPLFAFGYGLSYAGGEEGPGMLPEDVEGVQHGMADRLALYAGRPLAPWRVYIGDGDTPQIMSGPYAKLPDDGMTIRTADMKVQEDALLVDWTGAKPGFVEISGGTDPLDLSAYRQAGGVLSFEMKLDSLPTGSVGVAMTCGEGCGATVDLTDHIRALVGQGWQHVALKLSCFGTPLEMKAVDVPFRLTSEGAASISVADITVADRGNAAFQCEAQD